MKILLINTADETHMTENKQIKTIDTERITLLLRECYAFAVDASYDPDMDDKAVVLMDKIHKLLLEIE